MIFIKPTKNLIGITIQGDFYDFYEVVDSIHRIVTKNDERKDFYYGVRIRLLGMCYDIRHACMGNRDIVLEENGMSPEIMKRHNMITPTQNVYYSVNILFPEAIFLAMSVPQTYIFSHMYYGIRDEASAQHEESLSFLYSDYIRDRANLDVLWAGIWQALGEVVGDEELEKIMGLFERADECYMDYATHYIDKCNIELIRTHPEKRKDKLRNIAKRIAKKPQGYKSMEDDLKYWAKKYKTTIYELSDPNLEYPENFEW
ncbi:MAG: DUF6904 family protein [Saccharofermentanales bacterium]|nr:hypothetical protein [Clostridiaceae bacterium]